MGITVLLADDHAIMRQGLKALLEREEDLEVVAEATHGLEAVQLALHLSPQVIVMDMNMPLACGIEASRQILAELPDSRIVILSMVLDASIITEALQVGVVGYVLKDCGADELVQAIRSATRELPYLCRESAALLVKELVRNPRVPHVAPHASLTRRELDVLQLIADGRNAKEIAFGFSVSPKTIEVQRMNIMKKLNLHSVAQLTKYALRHGLTSLDV